MDVQPVVSLPPARSVSILQQVSAAPEVQAAEKERAAPSANLGPVVVGEETVDLGHIRVPRRDAAAGT